MAPRCQRGFREFDSRRSHQIECVHRAASRRGSQNHDDLGDGLEGRAEDEKGSGQYRGEAPAGLTVCGTKLLRAAQQPQKSAQAIRTVFRMQRPKRSRRHKEELSRAAFVESPGSTLGVRKCAHVLLDQSKRGNGALVARGVANAENRVRFSVAAPSSHSSVVRTLAFQAGERSSILRGSTASFVRFLEKVHAVRTKLFRDHLKAKMATSDVAHVGSSPAPGAIARFQGGQAVFEIAGHGSIPCRAAKPRKSTGVDGGLSSRVETSSILVRGAKSISSTRQDTRFSLWKTRVQIPVSTPWRPTRAGLVTA